jgi:hypothetical protein
LTELDIGEREAPEKDEIIVESQVDNFEEEGNECHGADRYENT